jgi:hypothetical protein
MGRRAAREIQGQLEGADQDGAVYHQIISWAIDAFRADTERVMALIGCIGTCP